MLFAALTSLLLTANPELDIDGFERVEKKYLVPPYVPRYAFVGLTANAPAVSPQVLIGWNVVAYDSGPHTLSLLVDISAAFLAVVPRSIQMIYQYGASAGLGYRWETSNFALGFQVTAGALWYRLSYTKEAGFPFDNRVVGQAAGRVYGLWRAREHFAVGVYIGYGSPWEYPATRPGTIYLGGWQTGVYFDWL